MVSEKAQIKLACLSALIALGVVLWAGWAERRMMNNVEADRALAQFSAPLSRKQYYAVSAAQQRMAWAPADQAALVRLDTLCGRVGAIKNNLIGFSEEVETRLWRVHLACADLKHLALGRPLTFDDIGYAVTQARTGDPVVL